MRDEYVRALDAGEDVVNCPLEAAAGWYEKQAHEEAGRQTGRDARQHNGGGHGGRGGPSMEEMFTFQDGQVLFVGALNCLRHKPFMRIGELMQSGRVSVLCPTMTDFSTGKYIYEVMDAIRELSEERNARQFTVVFGCQWVILSTDQDMIREQMKEENIEVAFFDDSHLEFGDHQ